MARKQPLQVSPSVEDGKVSLMLRLDTELHEKLRVTAEQAGISLNQMVQGICWGAIENVVQGEAKRQANGFVGVQPRKKCLFFGKLGYFKEPQHELEDIYNNGFDPAPESKGEYWFGLDFTNRGVVR